MATKMDLGQIVAKNDAIIDVLKEMERRTEKLSNTAAGYYSTLQDEIMQRVSDLLADIKAILRDTQNKTDRFAQEMRGGALDINKAETDIAAKIRRT